jgi:hypothetical protein
VPTSRSSAISALDDGEGVTGVLLHEDDAGAVAPGADDRRVVILLDTAIPLRGGTV